jgi:hypothetical protein
MADHGWPTGGTKQERPGRLLACTVRSVGNFSMQTLQPLVSILAGTPTDVG